MSIPLLLVTGASGQLGRLVIAELRQTTPADRIIALVRSESAAAELRAQGITVRFGDYTRPETLAPAFAGVDRLLLISSNDLGARVAQHGAAIAAARAAGVGQLIYTSLLHAATSPLDLAAEHRATEQALAASGLSHTILRNGWYTENYTAAIPAALAHGAVLGSAGDGRIASAARADFAAAAARVLTGEGHVGKIYELAGDSAYTLAELAAEIARQSGKPVVYRDLPQADYAAALQGFGLPPQIATMLAQSDSGAARGGLYDDSRTLSRLIGRPTTPLATTVAAAL